MKEYRTLHSLIYQYEKKNREMCETVAEQELVITKLQNHISYNMRNRAIEEIKAKDVEVNITSSLNDVDMETPLSNMWGKAFDFYGG